MAMDFSTAREAKQSGCCCCCCCCTEYKYADSLDGSDVWWLVVGGGGDFLGVDAVASFQQRV